MTLPAPQIVIFDMDGTSVRHLNPRLLHILEWLDDMAYKSSRIYKWLFKRKAQGPIFPEGEDIANKKKPKLLVHRALHKFRRKSVEQIVEPCPGIYAVLDLLRGHDLPIALVSNGLGKGYGHDILQKFDLAQYFDATIFREDITRSKPSPEPFFTALDRMGITPKKGQAIWVIGDRHKDITAAQAMGEHSPGLVVPIAYGLNAATALLDRGLSTDQIFMTYYDMHDKLEKLLGKPPKKAAKTSAQNEAPEESPGAVKKSKNHETV